MQDTSYRREIRVSLSPQAGHTFMTHFDPTFGTFRVIEAIPFTRLHQKCTAANHIGTILHISIRNEWLATTLKGQLEAAAGAAQSSHWPHTLAQLLRNMRHRMRMGPLFRR